MQKNTQNKAMGDKEIKSKGEQYHFSGGTEYKPMTVVANSQEEALKIYESKKEKVTKE